MSIGINFLMRVFTVVVVLAATAICLIVLYYAITWIFRVTCELVGWNYHEQMKWLKSKLPKRKRKYHHIKFVCPDCDGELEIDAEYARVHPESEPILCCVFCDWAGNVQDAKMIDIG